MVYRATLKRRGVGEPTVVTADTVLVRIPQRGLMQSRWAARLRPGVVHGMNSIIVLNQRLELYRSHAWRAVRINPANQETSIAD